MHLFDHNVDHDYYFELPSEGEIPKTSFLQPISMRQEVVQWNGRLNLRRFLGKPRTS